MIKDIKDVILLDEFDDSYQSEETGSISGLDVLVGCFDFFDVKNRQPVLDIGCGSGDLFKTFPFIQYGLEPNPKRYGKAVEAFPKKEIKCSWAEDLPWYNNSFNAIVCWGTYCFFRSPMEFLVEVNRVLQDEGLLIFDVVLHSTLPIAQTVNKKSFRRWVELFGFRILLEKEFDVKWHRRCAFVLEKESDFDARRFLMPQCMGKVNNYLEERDGFL